MTISDYDAKRLKAEGIDLDVAAEVGVRSIETTDDLPVELQGLGPVPGLLFVHTTISGDGVPQYRPDSPTGSLKYVWPKGVGLPIAVHPRMADRLTTATHLLVIEGTKQHLAGVSALLAAGDEAGHILPVGIAGCWGWSRDGGLHPDLFQILRGGTAMTRTSITLDADRVTNRSVWDAGDRLTDHIDAHPAGKEIRWVNLPGGEDSVTGLDDHLKQWETAEERAEELLRLLEVAAETPGRAPAKKDGGGDDDDDDEIPFDPVPTVSDTSRVIEWKSSKGGPKRVIAKMAGRVARRTVVVEDVSVVSSGGDGTIGEVYHDVEILTQTDHRPLRASMIPDADLGRPRTWLAKTPGGVGATIFVDPKSEALVAEAIRAHRADEAEVTYWAEMTGMQALPSGVVGYVHADGTVTPDGVDTSVKAVPATTAAAISYPAEDASTADIREFIVGLRSALRDPTAVTVGLGMMAYAVTGAPAEAAVWIAGSGGSGKTALAKIMMSAQGTAWVTTGGAELIAASSTPSGTMDATRGFHHAMVTVDDVKRRSGAAAENRQDSAVDLIIRLSYGGAQRSRSLWASATGSVAETPPAHKPLALITGEHLLDAGAPGAATTAERLIGCTMTSNGSFYTPPEHAAETGGDDATGESWTYREAMRHAQAGTYNRAFGTYIRWLTGQIASFDGGDAGALGQLRAWVSYVTEQRATVSDSIAGAIDAAKPRLAAVPSGAVVGWALLAAWAAEAGAITQEEAAALQAETTREVVECVKSYLTAAIRSVDSDPQENILGALRSAVATSSSWKILAKGDSLASYDSRGVTVLGQRRTEPDGTKVVAIVSSVAAQIAGLRPGALTQALAPIAVRGSGGTTSRPTRIGSGPVARCIYIPAELWDGTEDDGTEAEAEAA